MMIYEFEALTGFYPTPTLYAVIEKEYTDGPWKDKQEFCRAYSNNINGLAERLAREAHEQQARDLMDEVMRSEALRGACEEWKKEVARLERELDLTLEWKPYQREEEYTDKEYNELYDAKDTKKLSEGQAKKIIAEELGFDTDRITILYNKPLWKIDRYRRVKETGQTVSRAPLYYASDWNYIRFEACGYCYEYKDGEMERIW